MSKTFTYVIRSDSRINQNDNTNSCTVNLKCPSNYQYYDCEVDSFLVSTNGFSLLNDFCEIRAENLSIIDGGDTKNNRLTTMSFYSFKSGFSNGHIKFRVENFNNKSIPFTIYGDDGNLLQNAISSGDPPTTANYDEPWILVLKMTGVENA